MLGLLKAHRGRRAAAAAIIPFLDDTRRRLGGIPDSAWRDPYVVGFLGMLITVIAQRLVGSLSTDTLASVQAGAWTDITEMPGDVIGEEMCFLGASRDDRFILGCGNAESFFQALSAASRQSELRLDVSVSPPASLDEGEARSALWSRYFESHLGGSLTAVET
jgi:hypothetical protein